MNSSSRRNYTPKDVRPSQSSGLVCDVSAFSARKKVDSELLETSLDTLEKGIGKSLELQSLSCRRQIIGSKMMQFRDTDDERDVVGILDEALSLDYEETPDEFLRGEKESSDSSRRKPSISKTTSSPTSTTKKASSKHASSRSSRDQKRSTSEKEERPNSLSEQLLAIKSGTKKEGGSKSRSPRHPSRSPVKKKEAVTSIDLNQGTRKATRSNHPRKSLERENGTNGSRRSNRNKQSFAVRSVRFASTDLVHIVLSLEEMSEEEIRGAWYNQEEFDEMLDSYEAECEREYYAAESAELGNSCQAHQKSLDLFFLMKRIKKPRAIPAIDDESDMAVMHNHGDDFEEEEEILCSKQQYVRGQVHTTGNDEGLEDGMSRVRLDNSSGNQRSNGKKVVPSSPRIRSRQRRSFGKDMLSRQLKKFHSESSIMCENALFDEILVGEDKGETQHLQHRLCTL